MRDPVVSGSGVRGGEPGCVHVDLGQSPLQVGELDHRPIGPYLVAIAGLDQRAEVPLTGRELQGLPVDEPDPVDCPELVRRVGLTMGGHPSSVDRQCGEIEIATGPGVDGGQTLDDDGPG
jgi:hypothetical protein